MASGWTTSGIDWNNLRNNRTEDIIREIYLAVNERDYWIRINSGNTVTLDRDGRIRTETQLRYIYSKLKSWFKPISEYSGSFTFDNSESVFIDDTITPSDPVSNPEELFYFGYDSYNYLQAGNLETLISEDLGFLRDYGSSTYRVVLDELRIVKKILELDLRNRMFRYSRSGSDYNVIQFPNSSIMSLALAQNRGEDTTAQADSSNANSLFYGQGSIDYSSFVSNKYTGDWFVQSNFAGGYTVSQVNHGIKFSPVGYDLSQYEISDFNYKSFVYGFVDNPFFDDDFNILPVAAYSDGHDIVENSFINIPGGGAVTFGGQHGVMHVDFVPSGLPVVSGSGKSIQDSAAIPFINLNIEGFLNYYTEPTP